MGSGHEFYVTEKTVKISGVITVPQMNRDKNNHVGYSPKLYAVRKGGVLLLCIVGVLFFFRNDLALLFAPDPELAETYRYTFAGNSLSNTQEITGYRGFRVNQQGLQLAPHTSGRMALSFSKEQGQGCLLRVWFYGDGGNDRPNALKVSVDGGRTFTQVAGSGNYVGSVFEITSFVGDSNNFQLLFEAQNNTSYTVPVLQGLEVLISRENRVKPLLPDVTKIVGIILLFSVPLFFLFAPNMSTGEKVTSAVFLVIMLLAVYLRWNELLKMSGTFIDGDARGYSLYGEKMDLFSSQGFYSAQFEKREPLYILIVKLFFHIFGVSGTHLRLVSFVFSLATIFLTFKIGKEWFNGIVGLIAAFILAIHPYLIELSVRGLRAEWFTTLVLLFVYCSFVKVHQDAYLRTLITGLLIGCMLLTRAESLLMIVICLIAYPVIARSKWNYKMVFTALLLGVALLIPHQYRMYKHYGDPLYTVNQYTRFYANREFAGQPGFPTEEEISTRGMYAGRKITPFEYYFLLHTPRQLAQYSTIGFLKIHFTMPLYFAMGKGNLKSIEHEFEKLKTNLDLRQLAASGSGIISILHRNWLDYALASLFLLSFVLGVFLIAFSRTRMLLVFMVVFQIQTSFIAYIGVDSRLTAHSYPFIALCCGYSLAWFCNVLWRNLIKLEKGSCLQKNRQ
jgi:hypothetical protein